MMFAGRIATILSAGSAVVLVATLAGCSSEGGGGGIGGLFEKRAETPVDPNLYPVNYKADLLAYLQSHASEVEGVTDAYLSSPTLGQLSGNESRYFMCFRADGAGFHKEKMIVFFAGQINQYVNASGPQCGTAAFQPFPELVAAVATMKGKKK